MTGGGEAEPGSPATCKVPLYCRAEFRLQPRRPERSASSAGGDYSRCICGIDSMVDDATDADEKRFARSNQPI